MTMGAVLSRTRFNAQTGIPFATEYLHRDPSALLAMAEWEWKAQSVGAHLFPSHPEAEQAIPQHREERPGELIFGPIAIARGAEAVERERELVRRGMLPAGSVSKAARSARRERIPGRRDSGEVYRETARRMGEREED